MSYQALYRKYRPSTLDDVIGQDVVVIILKNAINNNMIGHAYMFSGPRGIGKTSIAKILAKTVNCLNPINGVSCEKCDNCIEINNGNCVDIIEIDAASNNGVDEIREIKSKISLVPNQLKYKVYIIDEVHMLSIGAFNALLKTLEEPPEHIIFILATTDLHKVPVTIISRCQCFDFNRISNNDIVKRLNYICSNENIKCDKSVLEKIAILSDGGLRDAVGMLDKLNSYSNLNITEEDFELVNGLVSSDDIELFLSYVMNNDLVNIISFIDNIYGMGKNFNIFIQDLMYFSKNKYIDSFINNSNLENVDFYLKFADKMNDLLKNNKFNSNLKTSFEISIFSFIDSFKNKDIKFVDNVKSEVKEEKNLNIPSKIEDKIENSDPIVALNDDISSSLNINLSSNNSKYDDSITDIIINNCFARANRDEKNKFLELWKKVEDYSLNKDFGVAACLLSDASICAVGLGEVIISFEYDSMVERAHSIMNVIERLFDIIFNKKYNIAIISNERWITEKNKFISNRNNGIEYKYKEIISTQITCNENNNNDKIESGNYVVDKAIELFGADLVQID